MRAMALEDPDLVVHCTKAVGHAFQPAVVDRSKLSDPQGDVVPLRVDGPFMSLEHGLLLRQVPVSFGATSAFAGARR